MNDVRALIPVLRRVVYLRRLFDWLGESLQASSNSTVNGYPELPILLLASLERMGDEIASVALLRYCEKLRALNVRITATKGPGPDADARVVDLQLDCLPDMEDQYRIVRKDCLKTVIAWLVIPALIIFVIALRSCRP
jgi:hypothetical protein